MMRCLVVLAALLAAPASAQLRVSKRADLARPVTLLPGQGAIVLGFRRPDAMSMGKSGAVAIGRYDPSKRDLVFQPRDAKKKGDTTTYWVQATTGDKKLALDVAVYPVSAGDYVLFGATPGPAKQVMNTFCLGAPSFRVNAGEIVYFGDITPYVSVKQVDGSRIAAMAYSSHPEEARRALAAQPALAEALRPAALTNGATYACAGQAMTAYLVPGVPPPDAAAIIVPGALP